MRTILPKSVCILLFLLIPCLVYGQYEDNAFDFGNISFSLLPKVMEDGSVTDISLGIIYNNKFSGNYRYRYTNISINEVLPDFTDSLNARTEKINELFLLPVGYRNKNTKTLFWAGGGLYYEYNKMDEKGFYDDPDLEYYGFARVNSYINDFAMHIVGPLFDLQFEYSSVFFNISIMGGIVPVFFFNAREVFGVTPLLGSKKAEYAQSSWGSPYLYLGFDTLIFKYLSIGFHYYYSSIKYQLISYNFDNTNSVTWTYPETTVNSHSFMIEASAVIPVGSEMCFQIGYGHDFKTLSVSSREIIENKHYLILGAKKYSIKK